jgi:hypothetical protein
MRHIVPVIHLKMGLSPLSGGTLVERRQKSSARITSVSSSRLANSPGGSDASQLELPDRERLTEQLRQEAIDAARGKRKEAA